MNDLYVGFYGVFEVPCGMSGAEMSHMDQRQFAEDFRREPPTLPRIEETMRFSDPISSGHDTSAGFELVRPVVPWHCTKHEVYNCHKCF